MKHRFEKTGAIIATTAVAALGSISLARAAPSNESSNAGRANTYLADQANKFPTPEQVRKYFVEYYKNTSHFLESIKESDRSQALYGALVIKASKSKAIEVYDSPCAGTRAGIQNQVMTESINPEGTHNVAVIINPVYKEFNGVWYVYGYESDVVNNEPPNFAVDTSNLELALKGNLSGKNMTSQQLNDLNSQRRRLRIIRLDDLRLGAVEYWGYGGTKPNFIQTYSIDGRNLSQKRVDAQHPQNGPVASYISDSTTYGINKYGSYQTFLGEHGFQEMPVGFDPGLPR